MISIYKDFDNPPKDLLGDNPKITKAVKQALYDLYHGKCAYTEEKLNFEEIEVAHYRPVSLYPALEFEWSNLLPVSLSIKMTLEHTSNHFPTGHNRVPPQQLEVLTNRKANSSCLLAEKPFLLHPEVDTPENHYYYSDIGSHTISAVNNGFYTIQFFRLNNLFLLDKRHKVVAEFKSKLILFVQHFCKNENEMDFAHLLKDIILFLNTPNDSFLGLRRGLLQHLEYKFSSFLIESKEISLRPKEQKSIQKYLKSYFNKNIHSPNYIFSAKGVSITEKIKNNKQILPLSIKGFKVSNLNQIKDIKVNNIPLNTNWIFLTGKNGFGKTLILQGIVQALWKYTHEGNYQPRIILELQSKIQGSFYHNYYDPYSFQLSNWCAYGANRVTISGNINADSQAPQKVNKTDSLFRDIGVLSNVEAYLINVEGKEQFKEKGNSIKKLLIELLPSIEEITIDNSKEKSVVLYREKAEDDSLMPPITFNALSAGNKSIIAMIGDMVLDLSESQNVSNLSDLEGIVLIDEIDIHLHPNWQKKFVQTLTRLFPKIQFIASTHSPIPLLGAPKETVILNVEKPSSREGIKVRKLDIDVTTLTPNTILTSPIFGFEGLSSAESEDQPRIYTQENYDDVAFEKALKENLKKLADDDDLSKYIIEKK